MSTPPRSANGHAPDIPFTTNAAVADNTLHGKVLPRVMLLNMGFHKRKVVSAVLVTMFPD